MAGSTKSLVKGSPAPGPVPDGSIRAYLMRFCPFAQRAKLVLVAKGIKHEVVFVNTLNKPDWFFEKSPFGLVPAIETSKGQLIYESAIVCDYLDEVFPGKKLTPEDPFQNAQQKMLLEHFSKIVAKLNTPYIGGSSVSMADYMMWPIFERFGIFGVEDCLDKTPHLHQWYQLMLKDPAVQATITKPEVLEGFFKLYLQGNPESVDYGI
ncbi:glutathione S-transferase omega 1 S homeolog isoform X1 [Xenopus laevis]|uniref:Glutathione S-transferase omega n=1 Tax=Xenopus laevis TaxID=8355 RepID=A0A8J0TDU2_XENLA|nr:glutathione S-transferase omega 1 S homeolog isoform X1 [Xenopus laevis]